MLTQQGNRIKTDKRDARLIAQCLSYGGYHPVYIPTGEDDAVKEYLRMRDDHKLALKKLKQQINAFVLRHGHQYSGTKWTIRHVTWLKKLELAPMYRETLDEYLASCEEQEAKIERYDKRIEEIASEARYQENAKKLGCFLGICSSFLGIGGGPINVALIIYLYSVGTKAATVCSLMTILFAQISKLGTVALSTGFLVYDLSVAPAMVIGAIAGGFIGASLNKRCSEQAVERAFNGVQLLVLAIAIFNIVRNLLGG